MAGCISPISSRNSSPTENCSNLPMRRRSARLKAPFSWPGNSFSSKLACSSATVRVTFVQRTIEVKRSADQGQVRKGLGEVSQRFAAGARLLGVQAQVIGVSEHLLEHQSCIVQSL